MRKHLFDVIRAKVFQLWKRPKPRLTTLFIILGMCRLWLKSSIRVFPCLNIVGQFNFCCFIYIFYFCPLWGVVRNMLLSWLNQHLNPMCMQHCIWHVPFTFWSQTLADWEFPMGPLERRWLWWLWMTVTRQWPCASGASLETTPVLPRGLRLAPKSKDSLYLCFPLILFFQWRVNSMQLTTEH